MPVWNFPPLSLPSTHFHPDSAIPPPEYLRHHVVKETDWAVPTLPAGPPVWIFMLYIYICIDFIFCAVLAFLSLHLLTSHTNC